MIRGIGKSGGKATGGPKDSAVWVILVRSATAPQVVCNLTSSSKQAFGVPVQQWINDAGRFHALLHPDDLPRLLSFMAKLPTLGRGSCSYRVRHANGRYRRWHEEACWLPSTDGLPAQIAGCAVPVSVRDASPAAARLARARLEGFVHGCRNDGNVVPGLNRLSPKPVDSNDEFFAHVALQEARAGAWIWDAAADTLWWNAGSYELYGFDPGSPVTRQDWLSRLHPDDLERISRRVQDMSHSTSDNSFREEFRIIHPSLGVRWVSGIGKVLRNKSGQMIGMRGISLDVTERKNADLALRSSEERLRLAMEAGSLAICDFDFATGKLEYSPEYARMQGYEPHEFSEDVTTGFERLHPEDHDEIARIYQEYISGLRTSSDVEFRKRTKSGGWVWIRALTSLVSRQPDGSPLRLLGTFVDISRRKRTELELRRLNQELEQRVADRTELLRVSEERFRTLAEATFEGVVLSKSGIVTDCNQQFADIAGRSREDIVGSSLARFVEAGRMDEVMRNIKAGAGVLVEHGLVRPDGSKRMVQIHGYSPQGPDGIRFSVLRDVTEQRNTEAELSLQRERFVKFQRLAELSTVGAGIVHQIGQPLTAALNNISAAATELSVGTVPSSKALEAIHDSMRCLNEVRQTIDHLRVLAHPEQVHREPKDLNEVVGEIAGMLQPEIDSARVRMELLLSEGLPPVSLDVVQFGQALLNVIRNAFESVQGCDPARRVVSVCTRSGAPGWEELCVTDRGFGIDPDHLDRVFDPFFTTKPDGMGVGLSLCRTIVQKHGGSLIVGNNPDGPGVTVCFELPALGGNAP